MYKILIVQKHDNDNDDDTTTVYLIIILGSADFFTFIVPIVSLFYIRTLRT